MPETQVVQIQCPNCGTQYQAPVRTVIDVGQEPHLRQAFLSGQINETAVPELQERRRPGGAAGLSRPGAEFLAVYFPPQLQIPEMEQQRMIGDLTQGLMRSLPPEQRKGYFLSPRQFVNRQNLMDAILGTMGISQEELDRQRKKMKMLERLMVMADDPKGLEMMIKGQDAQLDYEFFTLLASRLSQAEAAGDEKTAQRLELLRDNLMPMTTYGRRMMKQQAAVASLKDVKTPEELLDRIVAADPDEATAIAVAARPVLDYKFFQNLTARIGRSQGAEKDRLTQLRDHLLEVTEALNESARARLKAASDTLQRILESPNPRTASARRHDEIDDIFMAVLSLNMQEAERRGAKEASERLEMIYDEVMP